MRDQIEFTLKFSSQTYTNQTWSAANMTITDFGRNEASLEVWKSTCNPLQSFNFLIYIRPPPQKKTNKRKHCYKIEKTENHDRMQI